MDKKIEKRRERNKKEVLTDKTVNSAKPKEKPYKLTDGNGLFLLITSAGGKLWRWKYSLGGKEKLLALGRYPTVTLSEARTSCAEARRKLFTGIDPSAERKSEKNNQRIAEENSFANISSKWLEHWHKDKSPRHVAYVKRRIELDILPVFGVHPITEIEAPDLVAMAKKIEKRGATDIAKRALETTGQIFRYAIAHGYAKRNPASEIRASDILFPTKKTNYARVDAKGLPDLLRKIEVYQGTPVTRLAMKLMALTFVRTSELIGAKWAEFDLESARWDIPPERMKMRVQHIVPLSNQTIEILQMLQSLTGRTAWLFPNDRDDNKSMSNNTILKALERMGYKGRMTGHGFRGVASTILHEQGYNHEHIELQLAHTARNAVSAAYNHALYLEPRARMMQEWADYLDLSRRGIKILTLRQTAA
jgi:integrase